MAVRTDSPQSVGKHFARQACHTELEYAQKCNLP